MSEQIIFELASVPANPENRQAFEVELNWDKDKSNVQEHITLNEFIFVREDHDSIQSYLANGTNGAGPGVAQGMPFAIKAQNGITTETFYNGMLNFRKASYTKVRSKVSVLEKKGIDWLNEVADSVTFEKMFADDEITENDFIFCPYILNSIPDYKEAAISLLTSAFIVQELENAVKELAKLAASLANPFEATAIVRTVLEVLYIISLIVAIVKLIKDTILFIIQPVKYHAGMRIKTLFEKGAQHFGYTFKGDEIFGPESPYKDLCIIPEKYAQIANPTEPRIFNFTTPEPLQQVGYYKGTFGQFIRDMKIVFAAKIVIKKNVSTGNNELHFVREDQNVSTPQFTVPGIYSPNVYKEEYTFNLEDFISNYDLEWQTDVTDKNTIQEYLGTSYQAFLKSNLITDSDYELSSGLRVENIPFAQAKRKESLTVPEQICNALLTAFNTLVNGIVAAANIVINAVNSIIGILNSVINALNFIGINVNWSIPSIPSIPGTNLNNLISNRIGMLKIEYDSFSTAKLVILDIASNAKNTKINALNYLYLSAEYLYKNYHFIRSYMPWTGRPTGNQYKIITLEKVPFTFTNYLQVKESNICYDTSGGEVQITSLRWNPYNQYASITLWIPWLVINNLTLTETIPDGK